MLHIEFNEFIIFRGSQRSTGVIASQGIKLEKRFFKKLSLQGLDSLNVDVPHFVLDPYTFGGAKKLIGISGSQTVKTL